MSACPCFWILLLDCPCFWVSAAWLRRAASMTSLQGRLRSHPEDGWEVPRRRDAALQLPAAAYAFAHPIFDGLRFVLSAGVGTVGGDAESASRL